MRILLALIYIQNSITMPHLAVIHLMHVIKCPRSDLDGSCVNKNVHLNEGFYSTNTYTPIPILDADCINKGCK